MKTKVNVTRMTVVSLASMFLMTFSAMTPAVASPLNSKAEALEIQDAMNRLEAHNLTVENTIKFFTPAVVEMSEDYAEFTAAEFRLEMIISGIEEDVKYSAPAVSENSTDLLAMEALDNLNNLNVKVENSIRYSAPQVSE